MSAHELSRPGNRPRPAPKVHVCLESRYRKLERGLPQTIFYCPECKGHRHRRKSCKRCEGFGKLTKDSVQELLARHVLRAYGARSSKFHGAGREDIDVRMLGRGRPFVFEVVGAKQLDVDLEALRERINEAYAGRIEIDPWIEVDRSRVAELKQAEFDKTYRLDVAVGGALDPRTVEELAGRELDIVQRTPARVAHRRADIERERRVGVLAAEAIDDGRIAIDIRCSHGTYVKEWVSGDEGRTHPSLADVLGVPCRCEALDVLEIVTG